MCECNNLKCLKCFPHIVGSKEWIIDRWQGKIVYIIGCIGGGCNDSETNWVTRVAWWKPYADTLKNADKEKTLSESMYAYRFNELYALPKIHASLRCKYCPIKDALIEDFQYQTPKHGDRVIVFEKTQKEEGYSCWIPLDN